MPFLNVHVSYYISYTQEVKYNTFNTCIFFTLQCQNTLSCINIWDAEHNTMTSSNGNIFRVTGHLCGEFTGPRWIPHTKASDAELWLLFFICVWINGWESNREADDLIMVYLTVDPNYVTGRCRRFKFVSMCYIERDKLINVFIVFLLYN